MCVRVEGVAADVKGEDVAAVRHVEELLMEVWDREAVEVRKKCRQLLHDQLQVKKLLREVVDGEGRQQWACQPKRTKKCWTHDASICEGRKGRTGLRQDSDRVLEQKSHDTAAVDVAKGQVNVRDRAE